MPYQIPLLAYDIIDHCNLNCRNCSHFSQFKPAYERSVEEIETDLGKLFKKFRVKRFKIAGGEPLLHSDLCKVLVIIRKLAGHETELVLSTNGIKFNTMPDYFFTILKYLRITLKVSKYAIGIDYNKIEEKLKQKGVQYKFLDKETFFDYVDPTGNQDGEESFRLCRDDKCAFYVNGVISNCPYVANVPFINKTFNHKIEYDYVTVEDSDERVEKYLNSPCSTCRFCWSSRKREIWMREKPETVSAD